MDDKPKPQFTVSIPNDIGYGTVVRFNGQEVQNVSGVSFKTEAHADDVVRSTITIELSGEPILTSQ